jgi:subtilisin family serine protease
MKGVDLFIWQVLVSTALILIVIDLQRDLTRELPTTYVARDFGHRASAAVKFPELPKIPRQKPALSINKFLKKQWGLAIIDVFKYPVVVAVIDTGIDYSNLGIASTLWINPKEIPKDGIDNDNNGFIDDVIGWDFVHNVPLPYDAHGHGTHISGIVAGISSKNYGARGVCPGVSLMVLKYYNNNLLGYANLQNTILAINYAAANGAHIINYSGGGGYSAPAELAAIKKAQQKGILFVAAAGNGGRDMDWMPYYPAAYELDNII